MNDWLKNIGEIVEYATSLYPQEACGVVYVDGTFQGLANTHEDPDNYFRVEPVAFSEACDNGEVAAIFHSHPNKTAKPSQADIQGCRLSGFPWLILSIPSGDYEVIEPAEEPLPLIGRSFTHGVVDCYTLVQDHYLLNVGVQLGAYDRPDDWWKGNANLYLENMEAEGFHRVNFETMADLKHHDVILMQLLSDKPNHAAVFLAGGRIIHHLPNRLSKIDVYGGFWEKCTHSVWRHSTNG